MGKMEQLLLQLTSDSPAGSSQLARDLPAGSLQFTVIPPAYSRRRQRKLAVTVVVNSLERGEATAHHKLPEPDSEEATFLPLLLEPKKGHLTCT